jgi:hypothetical protein
MPHQRTLLLILPGGKPFVMVPKEAEYLTRVNCKGRIREIGERGKALQRCGLIEPVMRLGDLIVGLTPDAKFRQRYYTISPLGSLALTLYRHFAA